MEGSMMSEVYENSIDAGMSSLAITNTSPHHNAPIISSYNDHIRPLLDTPLDLTMVDLPGITRNPVKDQPADIYQQVSAMIKKHIEPQESIILNVLAATCDVSTCESIRMSKQVDKKGKRTLAVVTKADMQPQGLLEKVTADDVNIGRGYVCVRNRVGDETYQEAREKEEEIFKNHPLLSKIDKDGSWVADDPL